MKTTILIIEDDPDVNRNLEILLKEESYFVISANNGFDGLKLAKSKIPDLIICDIMMPKMDGYQVRKSLSLIPNTKAIPFLFLTAKTHIKDMRLGMGLGADDYLFKPYDAEDLLQTIKTRLNRFLEIKSPELENINNKVQDKGKFSENDSIFITSGKSPLFIKIKSIACITADRQYVNICYESENRLLMRKSLSYWESILPENLFIRIHRSTIININYIVKVEKWFKNSYKVYLKDDFGQFPMSQRYASKLKYHL